MNYAKVSAIMIHDNLHMLNLTVKRKNGTNVEIFNSAHQSPWKMQGTLSNEIRRIQRYLSGSGYHLKVVEETDTSIMYDIDLININKPWEVNRYLLEKGK